MGANYEESRDPIPPGHGEPYQGPGPQDRCPKCGTILQNVRPHGEHGIWMTGWCPTHGDQLVGAAAPSGEE